MRTSSTFIPQLHSIVPLESSRYDALIVASWLLLISIQDPNAALALVSARPATSTSQATSTALNTFVPQDEESDVDLKRAKDLIELHSGVRSAYSGGVDRELLQAREDVRRVLEQA
ncbi:hypothetical protein H2203_008066 [Taxawa tesnikishii (nom. ined.)]|nr:hypothetical protein H2203_008066 [Dothideales sp. JES 119]